MEEPLLLALHAGYAFVPLGLLAVALAALGWIAGASALHILTVGAIGGMTLAVMTPRQPRPHRPAAHGLGDRPPSPTCPWRSRPCSDPSPNCIPSHYHLLLELSGGCWLLAFTLFCVEYGPMLFTRRAKG